MMVENTHKVGSKSKIGAIFMFFYLQVLWVTVSVEESEEYTMDDRDRVTEYLSLDPQEVPPGEYEIRLRVWDRLAERMARQARAFYVIKEN